MIRKAGLLFVSALTIFGSCPGFAADLPGGSDPVFLKRFQGSDIISFQSLPYDSYKIAAPDAKDPSIWTFASIEGQITRIIYHVPSGHSVLELLRNYEQAIKDAGLAQKAERLPFEDTGFTNSVYQQGWQRSVDSTFLWMEPWAHHFPQMGYLTATGVVDGKSVVLAVWVGALEKDFDVKFGSPVHFTSDSPIVIVDVVARKAVENRMVMVKAADMADALATKGVVDLYGIYFDTDKSEVRPESAATLDEIASLLKIDRSLKLEISGHTDNTGPKDHNLKLSQARAQATMLVLVTKYGIAASRLVAKGYGDTKPVASNTNEDGRSKNRRVELRRL